jgi:large subunit ribosomal protein L2
MLNKTIFKNYPLKNLVKSYKKITGKNNLGKLVFFHRGGGKKKNYRVVDFLKKFSNIIGIVKRIDYNPLKKNSLTLICYLNGILMYNLYIKGLKVGSILNDYVDYLNLGSVYYLNQLPPGYLISNVENKENTKLKFVRSPGNKALILGKDNGVVNIKLPSGKTKLLLTNYRAILGVLGINFKKLNFKLKAGKNRNNNIRPTVRGVAMNPIDHPHGGGQGKTSGGRKMSVSP